jgi:hypothetical protein
MLNVTGLWKEGITGKGVVSALVDDGLDFESGDLAANFVSLYLLVGIPMCAKARLVRRRLLRFQ